MTMRPRPATPSRSNAWCRCALLSLALCSFACAAEPLWTVPGGEVRRGAGLIRQFGCAGCHAIPGIRGARGNVGPPLDRVGSRTFIAGVLRNNPANLVRWIRNPQGVVPGNAMPDMGITETQARDIAAYLYTLR